MDFDFLDFSPRLKEMLRTGRSITAEGDPIEIKGASTVNNLHVIRELIKVHRPTATLEIGLAFGASALTILSTSREVQGKSSRHSAIDPFQSTHWKGSARHAIEEEGFSDQFTLYEDFSSSVLPELVRRGQKFDLIYVDGSHLFEDVFVDYFYSTILLNMGGIILFDDATNKHVAKVIKFIRSNLADILEQLELSRYHSQQRAFLKRLGGRFGIQQLVGFRKIAEPPRPWDASLSSF